MANSVILLKGQSGRSSINPEKGKYMFKNLLSFIVLIPLILVTTGCGAIFYPERSGNTHKIDPKVAVSDGVGLLFFIIPGVVAYAIDFSTGCIYLSGGGTSTTSYKNSKMKD